MKKIVYFDLEVNARGKVVDIGAIRWDGEKLHSTSISNFISFISGCEFLCGHNIIEHDINYVKQALVRECPLIDTLYLSPILFPEKPYHKLLKDDKIITDQINNPLNDAQKAKELFESELVAFQILSEDLKRIYFDLLGGDIHFKGFFEYINFSAGRLSRLFNPVVSLISDEYKGKICRNADIDNIKKSWPVELAYALSIISVKDIYSVTPAWVLCKYPETSNIIHLLRNRKCGDDRCEYCRSRLDSRRALKKWFGYDEFRKYGDGENLQELAVNAAVRGDSLLAIFPTGGGKSLAFQLPALIEGETSRALTVVISPLQSLMKDQVENLEKKGIAEAVYINGLLSPVERAQMLERVRSGEASLLYIAPEQLRSKSIEKILMSRVISRFVIDEAHCFSAWGQDFRIDYMYIGEFLRELQKKKGLNASIPVSCFTATAKPKVISDIIDYFKRESGVELKKFATAATRSNLRYTVLYRESKKDKYLALRDLLESKQCPSIVFVSRTKLAVELADHLCKDGFNARAFHGQMDKMEKIQNQDAFINGSVQIIVATSAFGMGVDKSDVGLVVHYEISDSLENYLQEAGRAGRDVHSNADCYVLYNDDDLNKHFILLNQTKLTFSEINQVWKAIKALTKVRPTVQISSLEVARKAGWEDNGDIETKVKSAIAALESAGYLNRGMNSPRIYATSIIPQCYEQAAEKIEVLPNLSAEDRTIAKRIIKSLISEKRRAIAGSAEAESRIDYLSDILGIEIHKIIKSVDNMRREGLLAMDADMTAYLRVSGFQNLEHFAKIEAFLLEKLTDAPQFFDLKTINEAVVESGVRRAKVKDIRTILLFWVLQNYIGKEIKNSDPDKIKIVQDAKSNILKERQALRMNICRFVLKEMNKMEDLSTEKDYSTVTFSLVKLLENYNSQIDPVSRKAELAEMQEALLFLAKMGIISLEGGFMVIYNKLSIERLLDNPRYKKEDYRTLDEFYKQKIQQIHIVGEFANMIVSDYDKAMLYVRDYFTMDFKAFVKKYFNAARQKEIGLNVSPKKYKEIFGSLTDTQKKIISDKDSKYIAVTAGPGSGKTYVLVRKLASLILMEDVKSEQLLMLTFSRAAATEFKNRLYELIGGAAKYVDIKTFHSYCFDILGQHGTLEKSKNVVEDAVKEICDNKVEISSITKSILVIDEAQDMSENEFALVSALAEKNEDMRIIAVGDDDQNIYSFRGSDSKYLKALITDDRFKATQYDMLDNFRSCSQIVRCANDYIRQVRGRLKSAPIVAVRQDVGDVMFTRHCGRNFSQAIVNDILCRNLSGSTCVLTWTNEEALLVYALLCRADKRARLVQSTDGFSLEDLAEINWFLSKIRTLESAVIPDDFWNNTKADLSKAFAQSECLDIVLECINTFELDLAVKYVSDFENFIQESKIEDFERQKGDEIIVSTIHKSKGREYDNLFIGLKMPSIIDDSVRRVIYVGLTRAKNILSVHSDYDFSGMTSVAKFVRDNAEYAEPSEILIQLTHKDVVLDYFKSKIEVIEQMHSGQALGIGGDYLLANVDGRNLPIAKFSSAFREKMYRLAARGYFPASAKIRFIVYWHYEEIEGDSASRKRIPIILSQIVLRKR